MASIAKRPNGRWRARYRDASSREHSKHFDRKIDAQRWLDQVTAAVVTGQYVNPRDGKILFQAYAAEWAQRQPWRPKTRDRVEASLRVHILPALGARPIADVKTSEVQALVTGLSTRLAPSTVEMVYTTVRSVFRSAELDRMILATPCVRIAKPRPRRKVLVIPNSETVWALSDKLPAHLKAVPVVAAGLGLRPGELFGLQVADVDFLRRTVVVDRQLNRERQLVELKTPSSYRTLPLPVVVADCLAAHLATAGRRDGLVFRGADDRPVSLNSVLVAWRRAVAQVPGAEGLRLHDMRHSYASALIEAKESVKVVQSRMGHASAMITLDVYGHLWPDSEDRTRAAVDDWLAPAADSSRTENAAPQVRGM